MSTTNLRNENNWQVYNNELNIELLLAPQIYNQIAIIILMDVSWGYKLLGFQEEYYIVTI